MRRLRRPWLLAFPLAACAIGMVWIGTRDKGTVPITGKESPKWEKDASVAIASSDVGYSLNLTTGLERVFEPKWQARGEEKIEPVETRRLVPAEIVGVNRTSRAIEIRHRDGVVQRIALSPDGRSIEESIDAKATLKAAAPIRLAGNRVRRARSAPSGPPIPRPNVRIAVESDDPRDARVVNALLDDLVTAVHPRLKRSIAPMGLTNDVYFGHVFWDADVWVFPALALLSPEAAAEIPKYRLRTYPAARSNYDAWRASGRPIATGKMPPLSRPEEGRLGAKFAWESSESGRETVPGPSRYEDHISGSVAWSVGLADDLGLVEPARARELRQGVETFYRGRVERTDRGFELRGTVSPDEHHTGDNDLYTNVLAAGLTGLKMVLPRDERTFLTYDGDRGKGYKQAAALLAVYPLQYGPAEREAGAMLDRFAPGVIANGPAMTDAIHAIVAARIGRGDQALTYWRRSWEGFYDIDRRMFSERRKGTRREYFYTGAAGVLQAVLYGFVGLRVDRAGGGGTKIATLRNGKELRCTPHLPKGWRSVAISGLTAIGKRYDLKVYADGRVDLRPISTASR